MNDDKAPDFDKEADRLFVEAHWRSDPALHGKGNLFAVISTDHTKHPRPVVAEMAKKIQSQFGIRPQVSEDENGQKIVCKGTVLNAKREELGVDALDIPKEEKKNNRPRFRDQPKQAGSRKGHYEVDETEEFNRRGR